jgi:hypothetical protein
MKQINRENMYESFYIGLILILIIILAYLDLKV